ncbi:MAG TPA: cytochrome c oxidase assembly protein [Nocardioidaceae bacterium]|nr:cytochrome c oxidase assembly protein [Nocardioidaceae bacterium]
MTVLAHGAGQDLHGPALLLLAWATGLAVLGGWCYVRGLRRLRRHPQGRRRHTWRAVALAGAVVVLLTVSLPPVGELLEQRLTAHMAQHVVLVMVVAPLLALAAPGQPLLAGLPVAARRRIVELTHRLPLAVVFTPPLAWALHIGALWLWHLPAAYDAALQTEVMHLLEHASFLGTAWLFWWHLATLSRRRLRGPAAMFYTVSAMAPGAALGAMLTFAGAPLYPAQAAAAAAAGVDPLLDQRIGGLVMWVPLDLVYVLVAVGLFASWFHRLEQSHDPGPLPVSPHPEPTGVS